MLNTVTTAIETGINQSLIDRANSELDKLLLFYELDQPSEENIGLYTGVGGQALLMYYAYEATKRVEYLDKCIFYIEYICEYIETKDDILFTFSSGIAGCGWLFQNLIEKQVLHPETYAMLEDLDVILEKSLRAMLESDSYDLINGALGLGIYFIKRKKLEQVIQIVDYLSQKAVIIKDEIMWRKGETWDTGLFDTGLAHGSAGIIYFLTKCYDIGVKPDICAGLLSGATKFLTNNIQDSSSTCSYFANTYECASYISGSNPVGSSRLAWCYGDLSILYTLYRSSLKYPNLGLKDNSLARLEQVARNRNIENSNVVEAAICHGSSGIAYIFYKLWIDTHSRLFLEAASYWLNETLKFGADLPGIDGYKHLVGNYDGRHFRIYKPLLEGTAGVAMVYLSMVYKVNLDWDECLML